MFKFKDQKLWNLDQPFEWSSKPCNTPSIRKIIWNENGVGKTVRVEFTKRVSAFGADYQVYNNPIVGFKAEAFENSKRLPKRPREQAGAIENSKRLPKRSREPSAPPPPRKVSPNIYIFGEIHQTAEDQKKVLTRKFLEKGFFVLGEGLQTGENQEELDDPYADLRAHIVTAFIHNSLRYNVTKTINLVITMLKIEKQLPTSIINLPDLERLNKGRVVSAKLQTALSKVKFDYKSLYDYYFKDDKYKKQMMTLLNLPFSDIVLLAFNAKESPHWGAYTKVLKDAREEKMIERICMRALRGVAVFTGLAHMSILVDSLSRDNVVQHYMLPLSDSILKSFKLEPKSGGGGAGGAAKTLNLRFYNLRF